MIDLFPEVTKNIKEILYKHHQIYKKVRCKAEYLEEVVVAALRLNNTEVNWNPASHDKEKDIIVNKNDKIQIKSGKFDKKNTLSISGHRLGRFNGDLRKVTKYLNDSTSDIISVFNPKKNSDKHFYAVASIPKEVLKDIKHNKWIKKNTTYIQNNSNNVKLSLKIKMSWQIWWEVPVDKIKIYEEFLINS